MFSRRVESIKAERLPQIMTIQHRKHGEETDCYEEDFPFVLDDSSDEESEEKKQSEVEEASSPDSYFEFCSSGAFLLQLKTIGRYLFGALNYVIIVITAM